MPVNVYHFEILLFFFSVFHCLDLEVADVFCSGGVRVQKMRGREKTVVVTPRCHAVEKGQKFCLRAKIFTFFHAKCTHQVTLLIAFPFKSALFKS